LISRNVTPVSRTIGLHAVLLAGRVHRDGAALLVGAAGAAAAVHEGLGVVRELVVHDQVHVGDVQPARGDVRRHEHAEAPVAESA
jgi:hypothetical protein